MKVRIFRKCINRNCEYKRCPKHATLILGIGLGENTKYKYRKMCAYRINSKWHFNVSK